MNDTPVKRPKQVGTKVLFGVTAALLVTGFTVGLIGLETRALDPMWGGVFWGCGFCLGLYGLARVTVQQAQPAIQRAGDIVERAIAIRRTQTLKAAQRHNAAKQVQRRVDELTSKLWPAETRAEPLPEKPGTAKQTGKTSR